MSTVAQDVQQIREAIYGREVREAIADGIEHCYSDVSGGVTTADTAAAAANAAAQRANTAAAGAEGIPGTASLEDVNNLKSVINDVVLNDYVELCLSDMVYIDNEYVRSVTGVIVSDSSWKRSDYTPIRESCKQIKISYEPDPSTTSINALCFYNKSKAFISGIASPVLAGYISVPNGAAYFIYSGTKNQMSGSACHVVLENVSSNIVPFNEEILLSGIVPIENVQGIIARPNNLVSIKECVNNAYVDHTSGSLVGGTKYFATGFIPVVAGSSYRANHGRNHAWYKADKAFLSGQMGSDIQSGITAPSGAAFIRFTINKQSDGLNTPAELYFASINDYDSESVRIPGLHYWCGGKKINWIGDSIVDGRDFDEEVCEVLGLIKSSEYGINGSTIALNADGSDGRNALCERYSQMSDDADLIAVSCGTNDFQYAWCPIGDINSTEKTTFYGALKRLCEGLIDKYPKKIIFFTTPIKRAQPFADGAGGEYTADGVMTTPFSKNKYGKTLGDYADIIKEVCGYYSIPVLDMYRESLLNPHLASQQDMFDSVYTHPNTTGQKIMARRVAGWISQLGFTIPDLDE